MFRSKVVANYTYEIYACEEACRERKIRGGAANGAFNAAKRGLNCVERNRTNDEK
jgi:hypothetical protein